MTDRNHELATDLDAIACDFATPAGLAEERRVEVRSRIWIRTFGPLGHERPHELAADRRTPGRPLLLLALLLAGPRVGVSRDRLMAQMWPGDAITWPEKAFEVTLYRLRSWLGCREAVRLRAGIVSLDRQHLEVQSDAIDVLSDEIEDAEQPWSARAYGDAACRLLEDCAAPFCDGIDAPAVNLARERYRRRCLRLASHLADVLESAGKVLVVERLRAFAMQLESGAAMSGR